MEGPKAFVFQRALSASSKSLLSEQEGRLGSRGHCSKLMRGERCPPRWGVSLGSRPPALSCPPLQGPCHVSLWLTKGPTSPTEAVLTSPTPHSQSEPQLCRGALFSLKKHIPYNKLFGLILASTCYFFDIFNSVPLKGGIFGLHAYHKGAWNCLKLRSTAQQD